MNYSYACLNYASTITNKRTTFMSKIKSVLKN